MENTSENVLFNSIRSIIDESRKRVFRFTNAILLQTYWQIGKLIVEDEQFGNKKLFTVMVH
jgi:hypothetical protein